MAACLLDTSLRHRQYAQGQHILHQERHPSMGIAGARSRPIVLPDRGLARCFATTEQEVFAQLLGTRNLSLEDRTRSWIPSQISQGHLSPRALLIHRLCLVSCLLWCQ